MFGRKERKKRRGEGGVADTGSGGVEERGGGQERQKIGQEEDKLV